MPTIEQIRAARALIGWNQETLAQKAGLSQTGIARIENGTNQPNSATLGKIAAAFDEADIEFMGDSGVKKRDNEVLILKGYSGFRRFIYDVYETIKEHGGTICVSNVDEREFDKWQGEWREDYLSKMAALHKVQPFDFKIIIREGDEHHVATYASYKTLSPENFGGSTFYVYGNKMAIIVFKKDDVAIHIVKNNEIAMAQRNQFELVWQNLAK